MYPKVEIVRLNASSKAGFSTPMGIKRRRRLLGPDSSLQRLREKGAEGCVLLGDPAYYSRFGFKAEPEMVLPDVPPEYFQVLAFGSSLPRGIVAYHESFSARG